VRGDYLEVRLIELQAMDGDTRIIQKAIRWVSEEDELSDSLPPPIGFSGDRWY
jgi:hypothetical protein